MAYKRIDEANYLPKAEYVCQKTDLVADFPSVADACNAGATCTCFDGATHTLYKVYMYDGTNWNYI